MPRQPQRSWRRSVCRHDLHLQGPNRNGDDLLGRFWRPAHDQNVEAAIRSRWDNLVFCGGLRVSVPCCILKGHILFGMDQSCFNRRIIHSKYKIFVLLYSTKVDYAMRITGCVLESHITFWNGSQTNYQEINVLLLVVL